MNWKKIEELNYKQYMQEFNVNSLLAKYFASKNLNSMQVNDLMSTRLKFHNFDLFLEGEMAIDRILEAKENNEKICIYGDYDCDGILATTILVQTLKKLGYDVGYHIPNRYEDGYGLNVTRVEQMASKGYSLIITVDNGVKAHEAIDKANELGVDVIVSDHHEYDQLPDALAIIHTKMSPDYPFKEISGGFIAYKIASKLLGYHDKYLFSLAALTTISDMMPLIDENRSLVQKGLTFMKEGKYLPIELLLGKNQTYDTTSIGFIIAPKINSFGRLPEIVNPNVLVKYFFEDVDEKFAMQVAAKANEINNKRKTLTTSTYNKALKEYHDENFLYVYDQDIPEGLMGLVAGKFTNQYQRPSFVMNYDNKNNVYRGSARSVESAPLNKIFEYCKDSLEQCGGHAMAGGFSVTKDNLELFSKNINDYLKKLDFKVTDKDIEGIVIESNELNISAVKQFELIEPFGQGNLEPLFILEDIDVLKAQPLKEGKHLKFTFDGFVGLCFNCQDKIDELSKKDKVSVIGKLSINTYLNNQSINMIIEDIK